NTLTGFGEASRMTQFKDKSQRYGSDTASVGLFTYPILMAADILLYQANAVPVGEDQRQHIELTRDLAARFNSRFGDTLVVPEVRILRETAKVYDLQNPGAKMSKSGESPAGILWLMDEPGVLTKKVKSAVTDSSGVVAFDPVEKPGVSNLLSILSLLTGETTDALVTSFDGLQYGALKGAVAEAVVSAFAPIRERTLELLDDPAELDRLLALNASRAEAIADATLARVYDALGFLPRA
ncbi:MAG: tryptophan--tRNA ligase, partial [Microcella sp.]|nr:tryptophan--tRNA ligase [Microcella sp.]